jgi:hypothetical protein
MEVRQIRCFILLLQGIGETQIMKSLEFSDNNLDIDGTSFELEYNIEDARIIDNKVIVIYKFDELVPKHRLFNNCQAFDSNGTLLWTAEHPTNASADFYVNFIMDNKLWNFGCFVCTCDFSTGKLLNAQFTK